MVSSLAYKNFLHYDKEHNKFKIDHSREGFVYIIRAVGSNRIKIGFSKDPEKRIFELYSPQMPFKLELVYKHWFIDAYALEQQLHKVFKDFNVNGEWFEIPIKVSQERVYDRQQLDIADSWSYSKSSYFASKTPPESVLVSIGLDSFVEYSIRPIVRQCLESIAGELTVSGTNEILNKATIVLTDAILTGIINTSHPFNSVSIKLLDNLNLTLSQLFDTARYGNDMGFNGETLEGTDFLLFAVGVLSGIINAYSYTYDCIEEIYKEMG